MQATEQTPGQDALNNERYSISVVKGPWFECEGVSSEETDSPDSENQAQLSINRNALAVYYIRNLDFNLQESYKYARSLNMVGVKSGIVSDIITMSCKEMHDGELTELLDEIGFGLTSEQSHSKGKAGSIDEEVSALVDKLAEKNRYTAAMFRRTKLYEILSGNGAAKKYAFLYDGGMLVDGKVVKAIRLTDGQSELETGSLELLKGDPAEYKKELQRHLRGKPKLQLVMAYLLSGVVRQALYFTGRDLGELSCVFCITGDQGTGKTSTTKGLKESLFGVNGTMTANSTQIKLGETVRDSGVCPLLIDDASVHNDSREDLLESLYHLSNGVSRATTRDKMQMVYSPVIQSRESGSSLKSKLKYVYRLEGFVYRVFEVLINRGDLAESAEEADEIRALSSKYRGQGIEFLKVFMQKYGYSGLDGLKEDYEATMQEIKTCRDDNEIYKEVDDRVFNRIAVIALSAKLMEEAYNIMIDLKGIIVTLLDSVSAMISAAKREAPSEWLETIFNFYLYSSNRPHIEQPLVKGVKSFDPAINTGFVDDNETYLYLPYNTIRLVLEQDWE